MILKLRRISIGKVIAILLIIIIVLQIWHMNMLITHDNQDTKLKQEKSSNAVNELETLVSAIENAHVLDSSGTYHILTDVFGNGQTDHLLEYELTIASQSSSNHLDDVLDLSNRFDGPISIAVFTHGKDFEIALKNLIHLRLCQDKIRTLAHFHLVYPINNIPSSDTLRLFWDAQFSCHNKLLTTDRLNYDIDGIQYPHNLLRNTAVKFCQTNYLLVIDIDMIPNENLQQDFSYFVKQEVSFSNELSVLVLPSFEFMYKNFSAVPTNRKQLLMEWTLNKIRPFYFDVCWKCQRPTDYEKWRFLQSKNDLEVSYYLEWQDPWEPFYIARRVIPLYDERFKQYGFNRISQVCEMNVAGYRFGVLNNAFLVHKGFKFPDKFHKTKEIENNRNRDLYREFKKQLKTKYPNSQRSCG